MIILFYAIALIGTYVFIFRRKVFDFVSAGFFGCVIYFMPGFHGLLFNPYYPDDFPIEPASFATYAVWIVALAGSIVTGMIYNPAPLGPAERADMLRPFTLPLSDIFINILLALSFVIALTTGGSDLFSPDKNDVLSVQDRSIILFAILSQASLVLFLVQKKYIVAIPSILAIAFLVFVGFRAELAISALSIIIWIAYRDGIRSFFRARNLIPMVGIVFFLFAYKFLYISVKMGRWDMVMQTIQDSQFLSSIFLKSEPFITQSILNEVIARDFRISPENFFVSFLSIIPLSNVLTSFTAEQIAFNFQEQLFPNLKYGVASNIYANFYAGVGYLGIVLYIAMQNVALVTISRMMAKPNSFLKLALTMVGAFLAFYIHRNDIANSITLINRSLYCCLALWLIAEFSRIFIPTAATQRSTP